MKEVLKFPNTPKDICHNLRRLADRIESGEFGNIRIGGAFLIGEKNKIASFGWGDANDLEISGAFARASILSGCCIDDLESDGPNAS